MRRRFVVIAIALLVVPAWSPLAARSEALDSAAAGASVLPGPLQPAGISQPTASPQVSSSAQRGLGYYRFPALHGDTIVFAAEGDLWKVSAAGGVAQRLTTHPDEETDPVISPDGQILAFTARYEGPAELYTMPLGGGLPVRRTFEAESSIASGWTPAGELVYNTSHYATLPEPQLVKLDLGSGARSRIPLSTASEGSFDATGTRLFFVRPAFHRNVTKRYMGGTARKIWKFVDGADEAVPLTADYRGESHHPMWWNGRVYFVTDRDGTMNIWSMDEDGNDLQQHTRHSGWDVRAPSLSEGRIVYQLGADLWLYEITADRTHLVPITLASDFDQLREKWVEKPMQYLTAAHLDSEGEKVVLTARGRVFVAPAGQGRLVRASHESRVRYRDVVFMPDGERLLALTDASGELEFATLPANGVGEPHALTRDGKILRFQGHPSPDGKWVAYDDNNRDLWLLNVETGEQRRISANREGIRDLAWSPDSRWLAYSGTALNSFVQIQLYNAEDQTTTALTSDRVNSYSVAWSPGGDFIYFLSDRNLRSLVGSPWGPRAPEPYFDRPMKIYSLSLREQLRSPFKPDDELHKADSAVATNGNGPGDRGERQAAGRAARQAGPADSSGGAAQPTPIRIDLDGIERRLREVPVAAGNYRGLSVNSDALYWVSRDSGPGAHSHLMGVKIGNKKIEPAKIVDDIRSYELSANGKRILVRKGESTFVFAARPQPVAKLADSKVDLSGWTFSIDVREDWRQIFVDAWRLERDWFYDPGMHGVDWSSTLERYLPLVERVTTRGELSDLIGRVVGELSVLHTSVRGGDLRRGTDKVDVATLGARLLRDRAAGGYRIDYIYQSDPDYPQEMSPLGEPDLGIETGDIIETVNGVPTLSVGEIGSLLRNQEGHQVLLRIRSGSDGTARDLIVVPTANESSLRYSDWEYTRRLATEKKSGGKIGYVHLRAMGSRDLTAWYRQFYPVYDRQGLILDMRHNRGGNIDSIILEKLIRQAWFYWKERVGRPTWNMQYAFRGHMLVLVDQNTASDGEAFAEGFKRLGLGPAIGTRTWGGEVWLSSVNRLSDGGLARAPMMGVYGPEGKWLIEQNGVEPDIIVDNLPHATFDGEDAQLDAAIGYLLDEIRKVPRSVPAPPPYPDKAFRYQLTNKEGKSGSG
ncbi:MAG: S41 family peptidase [Acidobacteriota bacterium]